MPEGKAASTTAAAITARLDRLPATRSLWRRIAILSLGGAFEYYDLFFTGYVVPGMARAGLFTPESLGPLTALGSAGVGGAGTFVFMTFAGLFIGALLFGSAADRFGRRAVFTWSMLWYSAATLIMAFQATGLSVDLWRLIAGIGLGVELVTIDTYVAELMPPAARGRAFALNQVVSFMAVPLVALLAWRLVPEAPLGLDGWRWVVLLGAAGALGVWLIRRRLPESPRWLARQGRMDEAVRITERLEDAARHDGAVLPVLPPVVEPIPAEARGPVPVAALFQPPYRGRTILLSVFQICQTIGFYGFAAWVPSLLIAKGITVTTSLRYSFIIAISNPLGPMIGLLVADRIERKWQIVGAALAVAAFGLLFSQQSEAGPLIALGVLVTLGTNWMSFAFHGYQTELFPTRIRARAIGFTYAWSRLSGAFAGLIIAALLRQGGTTGVFVFIATAMAGIVVAVGGFGPRTRGRSLEAISP
ncbi:MFS transporter [Lichenihabitans sp. Uapishka_5]|uniref:MFS transporter n=1 Tax=Lichenihabitans sp. Uapishka_5 TaxID=3037302 RepID=UPI0029E8228F|nr:MFS transporter [Lichenihabitans sp. Uapishka_5]MDX7953087.1 MFS transporter [Lichenihabitans sp. Uapishka_5]